MSLSAARFRAWSAPAQQHAQADGVAFGGFAACGATPLHALRACRRGLASSLGGALMKGWRAWKLAAGWGIALALVFTLFGGLTHGYAPSTLVFLASFGFFIGAIAAPEFEPGAFRYPSLWQASFGALAGVSLAAGLHRSVVALVAFGLVGIILGYLAPYWIKHVQIP